MNNTPDPAFCFVTSLHTDITKTFHRIDQTWKEEARTGLATGAIPARQAESFRNDKLARSGNTGAVAAEQRASSESAQ